jgi:transcriptional antiterminator
VRKQKGGVKFSELLEERNKAIEMLHNLGLYQYVLSSNERVQRILAELLHAKDYMTIGELADCLWVSRGTVNKDLYRVRLWLEARKLELRSITKYGIKLVGQERDIRQAILQLLRENMPVTRLLEWMSATEPDWGDSHFFGRWLDNIDIIFLQNCIRQLEKELQVVFSDVAFTGLVLYLAVTIHRIRAGRDVVIGQAELEALQNSRVFAIALLTVNLLEEKFQLSIPFDEVAFFTEHILGSSVSSSAVDEQENRMELDALVCTLIASISRNLGCDLSLDRQLYEGLLEEIRPSLFRAKYGIKLENLFLDDIKSVEIILLLLI